MLDRERILALIPHQGAMCLLDEVAVWTPERIICRARSHLDPGNPLRRRGRLSTLCGIEYGLQAAALHGALCADTPQPAGYLAALRGVEIHTARLDDPRWGMLQVAAYMEQCEAAGLIYAIRLESQAGDHLISGRATIALPWGRDVRC